MNEANILYSKEGFTFLKNNKNNYSLKFNMKNNRIILSKVIDFSLVKLIYDLNNDIYERVKLEKIDDNNVIMTMLIRHLFENLGLPQRFTHVHMTKTVEPSKIRFTSVSINYERPEEMPENAEQMPIKTMICECEIVTPHHIDFSCNIIFENNMVVPQFAEKMVGLILFKIFSRVKVFIENMVI